MSGTRKGKGRPFVDEFVAVVKREIDSQQITMVELSRKANVNRPYLYRVLSGDNKPTLEVAERIAKALGLSLKVT